jgi:hypothetical protein
MKAELRGDIANDLFGAAIHGRRIDNASAKRNEAGQDFFERPSLIGFWVDIENLPRSQTDYRKLFSR